MNGISADLHHWRENEIIQIIVEHLIVLNYRLDFGPSLSFTLGKLPIEDKGLESKPSQKAAEGNTDP